MVYVSVMKDGVVHIVPSVNALVVAYMVVAIMVYASALLWVMGRRGMWLLMGRLWEVGVGCGV